MASKDLNSLSMDDLSEIDNASRLQKPNLESYKEEKPKLDIEDSPEIR